jgi:hypothetical protein
MQMNNSASRRLVLLLQDLGTRQLDQSAEEQASTRIQQLLNETIAPPLSERLEYTNYEFEQSRPGTNPIAVQGLVTRQSGLLLTEIIGQLEALDDIGLEALLAPLDITPSQARAATHAAYWILKCLEWESRDSLIEMDYPVETRERMIASRIRSLQHFRTTGEP